MEAGYQEAIPEIDLYLPRHIGDNISDSLDLVTWFKYRSLCDGVISEINNQDIPLEVLPALVDNVMSNAKKSIDLEEIPIQNFSQSEIISEIIKDSL